MAQAKQPANLNRLASQGCQSRDFRKATIAKVWFTKFVKDCDFSGARLKEVKFWCDLQRCNFTKARIHSSSFHLNNLWKHQNGTVPKQEPQDYTFSFVDATLERCSIFENYWVAVDFTRAKIKRSWFIDNEFEQPLFVGAKLENSRLVGCKLTGADFTKADLTGTNLAYADLTGAKFHGANLKNVNLRGANLQGVDLAKVKNLARDAIASPTAGPALHELDKIAAQAQRIQVAFKVATLDGKEASSVSIDSRDLLYGIGVELPAGSGRISNFRKPQKLLFSEALILLSNVSYPMKVQLEYVRIKSAKSPLGGRALWELMIRGIAEVFEQPLPADIKPEKNPVKDEREKALERMKREKARFLARKKEEAEESAEKLARKIKKSVGKVSDLASFLNVVELRLDKPKLGKATAMLKASGFKLFHDVTDKLVSGIVKSQTDDELAYACRIGNDGKYACCTQNLNICGGLRGAPCKHLLVLLIGLVQAGELDAATIDQWLAQTANKKAKLDKEELASLFVKYKGAEVGELDWRPTETVPEDYYAI